MHIKKKNVARLASLSALGAGALGVAALPAKADVIFFNFGLPVTVGTFVNANPVQQLSWGTALPGAPGQAIKLLGTHGTFPATGPVTYARHAVHANGSGGVNFGLAGSFLNLVGSGVNWGDVSSNAGALGFIARRITSGTANLATNAGPNNVDEYALFRFLSGGLSPIPLYGWLELSSFVQSGGNVTNGPQVTVYGWAYDNTGAQIAAGAGNLGGPGGGLTCGEGDDNEGEHEPGEGGSGGCTVPEPSTAVMFGFAALGLGATGLRRWRAARKPAA